MINQLWYLGRMKLFSQLPVESLKLFNEKAIHKNFIKGQTIYYPHQSEHNLYFLKKGRVKLYHLDVTGKEIITTILRENEVFGEIDANELQPSREYAEALDDVLICRMSRTDFLKLSSHFPSVVMNLNRVLSLRKREVEFLIEDLAFKDVRARIASVLLRLEKKFLKTLNGEKIIKLKLTHFDLSAMVGATRESVSHEISELKKQGLIDNKHRYFSIKNHDAIKKIAELG